MKVKKKRDVEEKLAFLLGCSLCEKPCLGLGHPPKLHSGPLYPQFCIPWLQLPGVDCAMKYFMENSRETVI